MPFACSVFSLRSAKGIYMSRRGKLSAQCQRDRVCCEFHGCCGGRDARPTAHGVTLGVCMLLCAALLSACAGGGAQSGSPGVLGAPRAEVAVSSSPWTFQGNPGMAYTSAHYRVLTTVNRAILTDRISRFAEASLARFGEAFPVLPEPHTGLEVFVLESRPEWERFVIEVFGPDGFDRYSGIERGGFTERGRSVLWDIGVQDTFAILAHEGWHQYEQVSMRDPLPAWLDEGIAVWAEGFRWDTYRPDEPVFLPWANVERFDQLRRASARGGLMPLEQLLTERPQRLIRVSAESTLTYYAQCWALVHYLRSDPTYREALDRLLEDAAAGRVGDRVRARLGDRAARSASQRRTGTEVWRVYFGDDLEAEGVRYAAYLARVVEPGAKNQIVRGESPVE